MVVQHEMAVLKALLPEIIAKYYRYQRYRIFMSVVSIKLLHELTDSYPESIAQNALNSERL